MTVIQEREAAVTFDQFTKKHRIKTRVDVDGTKVAFGKYGQIYEYSESHLGLMIIPNPPRRKYWGTVCRPACQSVGMEVIQDGDMEGACIFDPKDEKQVKVALKLSRVKIRRTVSPEEKERLLKMLSTSLKRGTKAP